MAGISTCCISGTVQLGTPEGKEIKLGGVTTYVATPSQPTTQGILLCSDLFGLKLVNTKLVADALAKEGFLTVVPDMFDGQAVDVSVMETMVIMSLGERQPGNNTWFRWFTSPFRTVGRVAHVATNLIPFVMRHVPPTKKVALLEAVAADLKAEHGVKSLAAIGFCYGAGPALKLASNNTVDVVAVAHPGMIKAPQDFEPVTKPGLVIFADHDDQWPEKSRKATEEYLSGRKDVPFSHKFYPGTFHGFVLRGDDKDPKIAEAQKDALKEIVSWIKTHQKN